MVVAVVVTTFVRVAAGQFQDLCVFVEMAVLEDATYL